MRILVGDHSKPESKPPEGRIASTRGPVPHPDMAPADKPADKPAEAPAPSSTTPTEPKAD